MKAWWFKRQLRRLQDERVFKTFKLLKVEWPNKLYDYSPRLKKVPVFSGDKEKLSYWPEAKTLEVVCPTDAIRVTDKEIQIDPKGCIACGLCLEFAPEGLLEIKES